MNRLVIAVAVSMASTAAMAQDKGWYVGGAFGQSKLDDFCRAAAGPGVSCDDNDATLKVIGGYQFTKNFALETGFTSAGSFEARGGGGRITLDAAIAEGTAVGILPLGDRFAIFGKAGVYTSATETKFATTLINRTDKTTNNDLTYGAGLSFAMTPKLVLRAEWQRYQDLDFGDIGKGDADIMSVGLVYRFF